MSARDLPLGAVAVRMHLFSSPSSEVERALKPPWPRWMHRLYELERLTGAAAPEEGEVSLSAAVSAVATRLRHRLELVAWCAGAMEEIGWEVSMEGDDVVAAKVTLPELARDELELHGIYGPLGAVCDLDEHGMPRLIERWETARER
ncbi:MAG TPA: hypothetical protein VGQ42_00965 [Candidatus Dormibacteraeota bacterium]|jgi:hypothetical protein|nr:hypothetical protein [Candidatus Dormibacteraeota bacterium]